MPATSSNHNASRARRRGRIRGLYPEFFARERMMEREEKLRWIHKIGRATGLDPVTGRKYREAKQVPEERRRQDQEGARRAGDEGGVRRAQEKAPKV